MMSLSTRALPDSMDSIRWYAGPVHGLEHRPFECVKGEAVLEHGGHAHLADHVDDGPRVPCRP